MAHVNIVISYADLIVIQVLSSQKELYRKINVIKSLV
jgi:hypothetical protein